MQTDSWIQTGSILIITLVLFKPGIRWYERQDADRLAAGGPYKYYLNPVSDGTRGARKTGYQFIDGAWYLFDLNSGALWTNMVTPNGMVADANGVLHWGAIWQQTGRRI